MGGSVVYSVKTDKVLAVATAVATGFSSAVVDTAKIDVGGGFFQTNSGDIYARVSSGSFFKNSTGKNDRAVELYVGSRVDPEIKKAIEVAICDAGLYVSSCRSGWAASIYTVWC